MSSVIGRAIVVTKTNKSGGSLAKGDVVIVDGSNDNAVTTTTTGGYTGVVGVVVEENGIANNASGRVQFGGHCSLVTPNASVTRGHYALTHTVAKQATDGGASRVQGAFGVFTTGGTTPEADLFTQPDGSSATGAVTHSTLGTTSVGGSFDTRGMKVKKITLATAGLLASINAHMKGNATNPLDIAAVLYSDSGGNPTNLLAVIGHPATEVPGRIGYATLNTTARWLSFPVGVWLAAGDYWIGVWFNDATGSANSIAYSSGTGSDRTNGGPTVQDRPVDSSVQAISTGTNDYSIYADIIR